jgi:hypothetical protein
LTGLTNPDFLVFAERQNKNSEESKMKETVGNRRYYLSEFSLFDGDHFVTFNIVDLNTDRQIITVAVTNEGRISVCTFDLISNDKGLFFEYGIGDKKIAADDFEHVTEGEDYE